MKVLVETIDDTVIKRPTLNFLNGVQIGYNLENDALKAYRDNVSYTKDYIVKANTDANLTNYPTKILPYRRAFYNYMQDIGTVNGSVGSWTEHPRPIAVCGTTEGNTIQLTSEDHSMTVDSSDGVTLIYNLIPQRTYEWQEYDSSNNLTGVGGSFTTEGTIRMIKIGFPNFRDLGGINCYNENGEVIGTVKYGKLFRGMGYHYKTTGYTTGFTCSTFPETLQALTDLGITDDLDLRTYDGSKTTGKYALDPGYSSAGSSITYTHREIPAYMIYKQNVMNSVNYTYNSTSTLRKASLNLIDCLNILADPDKVVYYHCATGADRAGILTVIVYSILGCSLEDIVKDYETTSFTGYGYDVNLGSYGDDGKDGVDSSKYNIRDFLYPFDSTDYTARDITDAIASWVQQYMFPDDLDGWDAWVTAFKSKMIE